MLTDRGGSGCSLIRGGLACSLTFVSFQTARSISRGGDPPVPRAGFARGPVGLDGRSLTG